VENLAAMENPPNILPFGEICDMPINTGGTHWILDAALYSPEPLPEIAA
jgi:hypothetical protein